MSVASAGIQLARRIFSGFDNHTALLVGAGDMIELDVARRRLQLLVSPKVLARRRARWQKPKAPLTRGYWKLYFDHVVQADQGADLDFLVGSSGGFVPRDNH